MDTLVLLVSRYLKQHVTVHIYTCGYIYACVDTYIHMCVHIFFPEQTLKGRTDGLIDDYESPSNTQNSFHEKCVRKKAGVTAEIFSWKTVSLTSPSWWSMFGEAMVIAFQHIIVIPHVPPLSLP